MSRKAPPTWLSIALYAWFDIRVTAWNRFLTMMIVPLVLLVSLSIVYLSGWSMDGLFDMNIVVVAPDRTHHASLHDSLDALGAVTLTDARPPDADARIDSGAVDMLVEVATDGVTVQSASGVLPVRERLVRSRLRTWLTRVWVEGEAGPEPALVGAVDDERDGSSQIDLGAEILGEMAGGARLILGLMAIGLLGLLMGMGIGDAIAKSGREGFIQIVSIGTSRRTIYLAEMVSGIATQGAQALGWWVMYGLILVAAGATALLEMPEDVSLVADGALLLLLAGSTMAQASMAGCVVRQLTQDLPSQVRERAIGFALMLIWVCVFLLPDLVSLPNLQWLGLAPLGGSLAIWAHHVDAGANVLWLVGAQLIYSAVAIDLGSRVFLLDESPITWVRRRWI